MASKSDIELKAEVDEYIKSGFRNTLAENHRKLEKDLIDSKVNVQAANQNGGYLAIGEDGFVDTDFINAVDEVNPGILNSEDFVEFKGKLDKTGGDFDDTDNVVQIGTGSAFGTVFGKNNDRLGFFGVSPIKQPNHSIDQATLGGGGGGNVTLNQTFGGYTIQQVVQALKNLGFLE